MSTYYGEKRESEKEIVQEILFLRESRQLSYQKIADLLNAEAKWPRWAKKWMWLLVRNVYMANKSPGSKEIKK
jgi:hypothetical protein